MLPINMEMSLNYVLTIVASLITICIVFPYFLCAVIPVIVVFFFIMSFYRKGVNDLKQLENVSRSPWFSHIGSTVMGLATIHAYDKTNDVITKWVLSIIRSFISVLDKIQSNQVIRQNNENTKYIIGRYCIMESRTPQQSLTLVHSLCMYCRFVDLLNVNAYPLMLFRMANRWAGARLELLVVLMVTITNLMVVLYHGKLPASTAGFAVAYAMQVCLAFNFMHYISMDH